MLHRAALYGLDHTAYGRVHHADAGPRIAIAISVGADAESPAGRFKADLRHPNEDALLALDDGERCLLAVADSHFGHHASHALIAGLARLDAVPAAPEALAAALDAIGLTRAGLGLGRGGAVGGAGGGPGGGMTGGRRVSGGVPSGGGPGGGGPGGGVPSGGGPGGGVPSGGGPGGGGPGGGLPSGGGPGGGGPSGGLPGGGGPSGGVPSGGGPGGDGSGGGGPGGLPGAGGAGGGGPRGGGLPGGGGASGGLPDGGGPSGGTSSSAPDADPLDGDHSASTLCVAIYHRPSGRGFGLSIGDSTFAVVGPDRLPVAKNRHSRAYVHPGREHRVSRRAEAFRFTAAPGDLLLAFTDGIDECHYRRPETSLRPAHLKALFAEVGPDAARYARRLVQWALMGVDGHPGGQDNIALVVATA